MNNINYNSQLMDTIYYSFAMQAGKLGCMAKLNADVKKIRESSFLTFLSVVKLEYKHSSLTRAFTQNKPPMLPSGVYR